MTNKQRDVFLKFYKDIVDNFSNVMEYFYKDDIDEFEEYLKTDKDRVVFFGKELLITNPNEFKQMLKSKLNLKDISLGYDRNGNVINILLITKEV